MFGDVVLCILTTLFAFGSLAPKMEAVLSSETLNFWQAYSVTFQKAVIFKVYFQ
jgi:hypothetical protein